MFTRAPAASRAFTASRLPARDAAISAVSPLFKGGVRVGAGGQQCASTQILPQKQANPDRANAEGRGGKRQNETGILAGSPDSTAIPARSAAAGFQQAASGHARATTPCDLADRVNESATRTQRSAHRRGRRSPTAASPDADVGHAGDEHHVARILGYQTYQTAPGSRHDRSFQASGLDNTEASRKDPSNQAGKTTGNQRSRPNPSLPLRRSAGDQFRWGRPARRWPPGSSRLTDRVGQSPRSATIIAGRTHLTAEHVKDIRYPLSVRRGRQRASRGRPGRAGGRSAPPWRNG